MAVCCSEAVSSRSAKSPLATTKPEPIASVAPDAAVPDPLANPPPPSAESETPFPAIHRGRLDNGLELRVVERAKYPLVQLTLVIHAGTASDGSEPGVAAVAGELMKAGGAGPWSADALVARAEALGSSLSVETGRDSTQISMAVTTRDFERALELLAAVVERPRFPELEFQKLKQRELERVEDSARSSGEWGGAMLLYRKLYQLPTGVHPYARFDAEPAELGKLTLVSCKHWYLTNVTPMNATLVIVGDIAPARAESAAGHVLTDWSGKRPPPPRFETPSPATEPVVWLVDRPRSAQSQLLVAGLGPERESAEWPAAAAANQILGGGIAGRLFLDVREKRSLAYHTGSSLEEPAHGPSPIVLSAGTQTAKTGLALAALLEDARGLSTAPPSDVEVGMASRYLSDSFLFGSETVGGVAALTSKLDVLGLPDGYYDDYRRATRHLTRAQVTAAAQRYFAFEHPLIVVAGDADRIAKPLSHFGKVVVVDPEHDFEPKRTLAQDPSEPLEAPATAAPAK
jgi:zinc protease